jgi:outer membrane receptor for ferrienterochelin and colicin
MYLKLKKIPKAGFSIAAITLETTDKKNTSQRATGIVTNEIKIFMTIVLFLASFFSQVQNDSIIKTAPFSELSLDELMNITVITASGSKQKISEAPSRILVITAQQIM